MYTAHGQLAASSRSRQIGSAADSLGGAITSVSSATSSTIRHSTQCRRRTDTIATVGTDENMPATPSNSASTSTARVIQRMQVDAMAHEAWVHHVVFDQPEDAGNSDSQSASIVACSAPTIAATVADTACTVLNIPSLSSGLRSMRSEVFHAP